MVVGMTYYYFATSQMVVGVTYYYFATSQMVVGVTYYYFAASQMVVRMGKKKDKVAQEANGQNEGGGADKREITCVRSCVVCVEVREGPPMASPTGWRPGNLLIGVVGQIFK
jgi:hypothetical protein